MVQIRNVPAALHKELKGRAAEAGMSLSEFLLAEVRRAAERPTLEQMRARLRGRREVHPAPAPADLIRELRDRA